MSRSKISADRCQPRDMLDVPQRLMTMADVFHFRYGNMLKFYTEHEKDDAVVVFVQHKISSRFYKYVMGRRNSAKFVLR